MFVARMMPSERGLTRAVAVVEEAFGLCVVDRDDRVAQHPGRLHGPTAATWSPRCHQLRFAPARGSDRRHRGHHSGVIRLRAMEAAGVLRYPIVAVNDAETKRLFDNRYGTGQSTLDGIIRATNILVAGKRFVRRRLRLLRKGVAARRGALAPSSPSPRSTLCARSKAVMDGFRVEPMAVAAREGEVFVTVTGNTQVLRAEHFAEMRDGAIVATPVTSMSRSTSSSSRRWQRTGDGPCGRWSRSFTVISPDGARRRIRLLAEGRLVNLSAAEGHPAAVMDLSFANHALAAEWLAREPRQAVQPRSRGARCCRRPRSRS